MSQSTSPASNRPTASRWLIGGIAGLVGVLALAVIASTLLHRWAYKKELVGGYALVAVDVREQMNISRLLPNGDAVGIVGATVFAVGWNEDFIIAQRHAPSEGSREGTPAPDFYLLRVSDGELWGPLTVEQFRAERTARAVPNGLDFTVVFQDLQ